MKRILIALILTLALTSVVSAGEVATVTEDSLVAELGTVENTTPTVEDVVTVAAILLVLEDLNKKEPCTIKANL